MTLNGPMIPFQTYPGLRFLLILITTVTMTFTTLVTWLWLS